MIFKEGVWMQNEPHQIFLKHIFWLFSHLIYETQKLDPIRIVLVHGQK